MEGNPAAVVLLPSSLYYHPKAAAWMQRVAIENNLSETAYTSARANCRREKHVVEYDLRWFTPGCEVNLCGHATLATAVVLYEQKHVPLDHSIVFHTLSGELKVSKDSHERLVMDFPVGIVDPKFHRTSAIEQLLLDGLGLTIEAIVEIIKIRETKDLLVHIDEKAFASIRPDTQTLRQLDARGVIVTAQDSYGADHDIQSRYFAPQSGVNEDPVTGSAHCALASYWSPLLNKTTIKGYQSSPTRGGLVWMELKEDDPNRVWIKGHGVLSLCGMLLTSPASW